MSTVGPEWTQGGDRRGRPRGVLRGPRDESSQAGVATATAEQEKGLGNSTIFPSPTPGSVLPVLSSWDFLPLLRRGGVLGK